MGHRNRCKARMIPQQNKKICAIICFCQLVVVISCVSLIYLTVVIYIPSYRAFNSGFEVTPVMCQTLNTSTNNNCSWASCGEWCLTKASGFCPQIHATVRQNGTTLEFRNCSSFHKATCPPVNPGTLKRFNCNNGTECSALKGLFNCSLGHCSNMSEIFDCHYKADGFTVDTEKDNAKLSGFFECKGPKCMKIKKHFNCDRICPENVTTTNENLYISVENSVYLAKCEKSFAFNVAKGKAIGEKINASEIWKAIDNKVLMMSCYDAEYDFSNHSLRATDCINGTIYNSTSLLKPSMTFKQYWNLTSKSGEKLDKTQKFVPMQSTLTIYNHSRLYINLDGCVNTLKGECMQFLHSHGKDGKNKTAKSRYPCFYTKDNSFMVVARYDLHKTKRELTIALSIPTVFFVISFITLCIITQSVRVDDDTKMRCKYCCTSDSSDLAEMIAANNKYELSSPTSDDDKVRQAKT